MYLRYGDLSWDSIESHEGQSGVRLGGGSGPQGSGSSGGGDSRRRRRRRAAGADERRQTLRNLPSILLHGVKIHAINEPQAIKLILEQVDAGRGGVVVTPNLDHIRRAMRDITFGALLSEADLVVADGMPLVWAARLQGTPLPGRVAGSDLISTLSAAAAERGKAIFLLGGAPGAADGAAEVLRQRHPHIRIVGTLCPPMGFEHDERQTKRIIDALRQTRPDIVFVALGSPKQENLINQFRLMLPDTWWLGVGNSFSFLCGEVLRAPRWMQTSGLEWVHRLMQEPRRLFKRYILVGLPFAASMMSRSAIKGIARKLRLSAPEIPPPSRHNVGDNGYEYEEEEPTENPRIGNGDGDRSIGVASPADAPRPPDNAPATATAAAAVVAPVSRPTVSSQTRAQLRGVILLGGTVRPTPVAAAIERSVLDLPLDDGGSIFNHWLSHAMDLSRLFGIERLPVRLMIDRGSPEPVSAANRFDGTYAVERDHGEYRGTGGVLRDIAIEYDGDDLLLVANAAQILLDPLSGIAALLDRQAGDVTVVSHQDGSPSGIMLVKCKTLRLIPRTGFVDMKEQALPQIASEFDVRVAHRRRPTGLHIRSLADYITGLRLYHRRRIGRPAGVDPLAEDWRPTFAIVEPGAIVDPRARVHDSVVLRGGTVEAGAVLVRSVVCAGGIVRHDRSAVDQFVCPTPED